ncbi:hypothetical protein GNI_028080 [Gregarina niphandrodes]|uniref:Transmembrane protein n=1 Tax=Gregarina niphandrodes TaxID=110365 RepID=A0A023BB54_GRENI|nr:hypothetical protein GNI_028080 [Gregarina niphandrodes]EZG79233.1 hypothetical protein GNI_028080 [Gregarina niphandrodes]|eukprot:XP_011129104.1 hypothetical protein GNI_028080 [Gregarina niphandrodes]
MHLLKLIGFAATLVIGLPLRERVQLDSYLREGLPELPHIPSRGLVRVKVLGEYENDLSDSALNSQHLLLIPSTDTTTPTTTQQPTQTRVDAQTEADHCSYRTFNLRNA